MTTYKKISILAIIFVLSLLVGFTFMQDERKGDNQEQKNINNYDSGTSYSERATIRDGIESDTIKRLKTHSESGTGWGMNPFGSGKPLTEETPESGNPQKITFRMPNIEWKTRTISGVTYEFGKGNPKEVALDEGQIREMGKRCEDTNSNQIDLVQRGICNPESGLIYYVTPEAEKYLLLALSDPNWKKLATECEKNFRVVENNDTLINGRNDPSFPYFDRVFAPGFLDIDHFISIDPITGLKVLNSNLLRSLPFFLSEASHYWARKEDGFINPYGDCVDQYGTEIVRNLSITLDLYKNSLDYIQGYTNTYLLSKNFTLSNY